MEPKVVIITGASSGIGSAVALLAGRKGYRLSIFARREDRLRQLARRIEQAGGQVHTVVGDVSSLEDQQRLIDETIQTYGRLDVLLNNAGLPLPTSFAESSPDDLRRQWDVNVTALATLIRIALPHLKESGGTVINVGSLISRVAVPGMGNYGPTKIAVAGLTDALRRELVPLGINVCLVEPGPVSTEFTERAGGATGSDAGRFSVPVKEAAKPIVRLFGQPRKLTVIPGWLAPVMAAAGGLGRVASPVVDAVFYRMGQDKG